MRNSLVPVLALLLGCSSGSSSTTSNPGTDYCKADEERTKRCNTGDVFDPAECSRVVGCWQKMLIPSELNGILACVSGRACDASDDPCFSEPAKKYVNEPSVVAYVKACTDKRAACSNAFSDDYCSPTIGLMNPTWVSKLQACYSKPCAEVTTCYAAVLEAEGCGK